MPRNLLLALALLGLTVLEPAAAAQISRDHVVVTYSGISSNYAQAIARTVAAARQGAIAQFGFDLPTRIQVSVQVNGSKTQLWTNGRDQIYLTLVSEQNLRKPQVSGYFQLYGLCHEVGHMAMYRLIPNPGWMTAEAAEGWAHYLGSRLVDMVYAQEGPSLWPDSYDYREDGMKRLLRQLAGGCSGAGVWYNLVQIVGDGGVAPVFRVLGPANSANQAVQLGSKLATTLHDERLLAWWQQSQVVITGIAASSPAPPATSPTPPAASPTPPATSPTPPSKRPKSPTPPSNRPKSPTPPIKRSSPAR